MIEFDTIYERRTFHPRDKILQNIESVKGKSSSKLEEMLKSKRKNIKLSNQIEVQNHRKLLKGLVVFNKKKENLD